MSLLRNTLVNNRFFKNWFDIEGGGMTENYRTMKASELCEQYIKIVKENGSDPRLKEIQAALEKHKITVEWPEDEIEEVRLDKSEKYRFYYATIIFIKNESTIAKEFKNVLVKIPNKEIKLLETKKLTSQDLKFLRSLKILPWES